MRGEGECAVAGEGTGNPRGETGSLVEAQRRGLPLPLAGEGRGGGLAAFRAERIPANSGAMTPDEFIEKWKPVALTERATAHTHIIEGYGLFGQLGSRRPQA